MKSGILILVFLVLAAILFSSTEAYGQKQAPPPAAPPRPDYATLVQTPQIQALIAKVPELLKNADIYKIVTTDPVKQIFEPVNVQRAIMTGSLERLATPEYITKLLSTPLGEKLKTNQEFMNAYNGPNFKEIVNTYKPLIPIFLAVISDELYKDPNAPPK